MGDNVLSEEAIFEAADVTPESGNIEEIKYVGFSVQQFSDISILGKMKNLRILTLKLCALPNVPDVIFQLNQLQNLDLSGNQIQTLPDELKWKELPNLRLINLSDNNISEIQQIFNMKSLPNLKQLMLTGNICLSVQESFNRITKLFKSLAILNDLIITSQHRGYLDGIAVYEPTATLPISKTDDFFFLYVKYMHVGNNERYVRRANADFFCLSRVIRKYSAAEKIQSVFRGYLVRKRFKLMRRNAIFIQCIIKRWFWRRNNAAKIIQRNFLYYKTKKEIKFIRSVRLIQSIWRRRSVRQKAVINAMDEIDKHEIFLTAEGYSIFLKFCEEHNIPHPDYMVENEYKIIKFDPPKQVNLPGSPFIYYWLNSTLIVREIHESRDTSNKTIWCSHDHSATRHFQRATAHGINWTKKCPFSSIKPYPYTQSIKPVALKRYQSMVRVGYKDFEVYSKVILDLNRTRPQNLILFPPHVIRMAAAQITIQSAARCFLERARNFKDLRQQVIEGRAKTTIKYWIRTISIHRSLSFIATINRFMKEIPEATSFFIPSLLFQELNRMKSKHRVNIGYTTEKLIATHSSVDGFLPEVVPHDHIIFELSDPASVVKFGSTVGKASPSHFTLPIPAKWIRRFGIMRVTYTTPLEAKRRMVVFAWITGNTRFMMSEKDIIEYCSASCIKALWIGQGARKMLRHLGMEADLMMRMRRAKKKTKPQLRYADEDTPRVIKRAPTIDPNKAIAKLRDDYTPWSEEVEKYKERRQNKSALLGRSISRKSDNEDESKKVTQSKQLLGLVQVDDTAATETLTRKSMHEDYEDNSTEVFSTMQTKSRLRPESESSNSSIGLGPIITKRKSQSRQTSISPFVRSLIDPTDEDKKRRAESRIYPLGMKPTSAQSPKLIPAKKRVHVERPPLYTIQDEESSEEPSTILTTTPTDLVARSTNNLDFDIAFAFAINPSVSIATLSRAVPIRRTKSLSDIRKQILKEYTSMDPNLFTYNPLTTRPEFDENDDEYERQRTAIEGKTSRLFCFDEPNRRHEGPSAQQVDNTRQEWSRIVFQRLARLHQISEQIMREMVVDHTIEERRNKADRQRSSLAASRELNTLQRQNDNADIVARNKIERQQLAEQVAAVREKTERERARKMAALKKKSAERQQKIRDSKAFGQAFVSASRSIAQQVEKTMRKGNQAKILTLTRDSVAESRRAVSELKTVTRERIKNMEGQRQRLAQLDRAALEMKRKEVDVAHKQFLRNVQEMRAERKDTMLRSIQRRSVPNRSWQPDPEPTELWDEVEEAAAFLMKMEARNCGFQEAHILAEMLDSIVN